MSKLPNFYKFCHTNWVDIAELYKHISGQPRGYIYHVLGDVVRIYREDWFETIEKNTGRNYNRFLKLLKYLGIRNDCPQYDKVMRNRKFSKNVGCSRHRDARAQSLDDIINFPSNATTTMNSIAETSQIICDAMPTIQETFANINQSIPTIANTMQTVSEVSSNIDEVLQAIKGVVDTFKTQMNNLYQNKNDIIKRILDFLIQLVSAAYLLSQKANQTISNAVAIFTLILPNTVTCGIQMFASGLIRVIKGLSGATAQGEEDNQNFIVAFFKLTASIIQGMYTDIPKETFDSMHIGAKKVKLISDYLKGTSTIVEYLVKGFSFIMEIIGDKILKYYGILPGFIKEDTLSPLVDQFVDIKLTRKDQTCMINKEHARIVMQLYEELLKYEAKMNKLNKNKIDLKVTPYVRIMVKSLESVVSRLPDHFRTGVIPRRIKPFWVYIYGDPRIGKSAVVQPYIVNILAQSMGLISQYQDYTNYTYLRNCGEEYWEGYANHPVLWYNDLFQNYAQAEAMHMAVLELTNIVDDNVYPLNMAFEQKHNVFFNSDLVISNAQDEILGQSFIADKCWSGGSHLYARRDVCICVALNQNYAKSAGATSVSDPGIDYRKMYSFMQLHPDKCVGYEFCTQHTAAEYADKLLFPNDLYTVIFTDPMTGIPIQAATLPKAMEIIANKAHDYAQTQGKFKNRLYNHFEDLFKSGRFKPKAQGEDDHPKMCVCPECMLDGRHVYVPDEVNQPIVQEPDDYVDAQGVNDMHSQSCRCPICIRMFSNVRFSQQATTVVGDHYVDGSWHQMTLDQIVHTFEGCANQQDQCERHEWIDAQLRSVRRALEQSFPDLIGSEDFTVQARARVLSDNRMELLYVWHARGYGVDSNGNEADTAARISLAIEILGDELVQSKTFWQGFKSRFNHALITIRNYFRAGFEFGPVLLGVVQCVCVIYLLVKLIKFYSYMIKLVSLTFTRRGQCTRCNPMLPLEKEVVEEALKGDFDKAKQIYETYKWCPTCHPTMYTEKTEIELQAQTAEGKSKPARPQVLRVKKNKQPIAQSYDQQNSTVEGIVSKQICKWKLVIHKEGVVKHERIFGSGLCLGSDIFVTPHHFYFRWLEMRQYWESKGDIVDIYIIWSDTIQQKLDWDSIKSYQPEYDHLNDIIFLRIVNLVQKSHLKKFFVYSTDRPVLRELYLYGKKALTQTLTTMMVHSGEYTDQVYKHESMPDPLYGGKFSERSIVVPQCISYRGCLSTGGDCGLLVMHCDSSLNCRKIIGMHTAGVTSAMFGIGSLIFQEDIEEVFKHFYPDDIIYSVAQEYRQIESEDVKRLETLGLTVLGEIPRLVEPEFKCNRVPILTLPRKSKISKSLVYDIMEEDYGPSTVAPARLRPFELDGEVVSPFFKAMTKLPRGSPMVLAKYDETIVEHLTDTFFQWRSHFQPEVLSIDSTINGEGLLNAVEMTTSAGFPYSVLDNSNGKAPFFKIVQETPRKYAMGPFLQRQYEDRITKARQGEIKETYFIDTLKDETRELEKVRIGKTRMFQIAPMDLNLLMRQYFGAFINHAQSCYIDGEGAVGINANSHEWTVMINRLKQVGLDFINGDGENYDASGGQPIGMSCARAINGWYRFGRHWKKEDDLVRLVLFATFLNSKHIHRNIIYQLIQGNKSGTTVTTWFNILIGMYVIRLTYLRLGYNILDFHRFVRPKFFGDDDLIATNRNCLPLLTCKAHAATMASVGIIYTSATKGEVAEEWYSLDQVSFLKRNFYYDGIKYLPRLQYQTILEIARWSESDPENMVDQMNRFNSALLEMSNYGRDPFETMRNHFKEYCYLLNNMGYVIDSRSLFSYDYCEDIKWGTIYSPKGLYDRSENFGEGSEVHISWCDDDVKLPTLLANSCKPNIVNTTGQAQTHEGKAKPSKPQIVRRPKYKTTLEAIVEAQGEESDDFECYLLVLEQLKQMEPCIRAVNKSLSVMMRKPEVVSNLNRLHDKVRLMVSIYNECKQLITGDVPIAQGEEVPLPQRKQFAEAGIMGASTGQANTDNVVDVQKITTYVDDEEPHQPPVMHNAVPHPNNSNIRMDSSAFMETPLLIDQFLWQPVQTLWSLIGTWAFPKEWLSTPEMRSKLAMVQFCRPDMEIEIFCNSTKFHYGRLVFAVMPLAQSDTATIPNAYIFPYNAFTWPNWYQLSAGTGQSLKFIVPFRHFYSQICLTDNSWEHRRLFSIFCWVASPLLSSNVGAGGVTAPVEVTMYARLVKPHFAGRVHTGAVAQGEELDKSERAVVNVPTIAASSQRVPSSALSGLSKVTKDMSEFVYNAGMSVPVNLGTTNGMQVRQPLFSKCDDSPNSVVLGPAQAVKVVPSREYVNADDDDMNINAICGHPSLLALVKITAANTVGSIPWQIVLNPTMMNVHGEGVVNETNSFYPLPMSYIANMFLLWRGGFKFHLSAVCSSFHSCRLRLMYIPGGQNANVNFPTSVQTASLTRNVIWDINKSSDITVEIPYEANTHWRTMNVAYKDSFSGRFGIQILNKLTSADPSGVVSPIYIQIFASAADDFQFNKPLAFSSFDSAHGIAWAPDVTHIPGALAQGEEDPCSIPASSASCLRLQKGLLMGDVDAKHRKYHDCNAFVYTSLKQLCNQLTPMTELDSSPEDTHVIMGLAYSPYGTGWNHFTEYDDIWHVPMHRIIPLFRFMRGGFRVAITANDKIQACAWVKRENSDTGLYSLHNSDILNYDTTSEHEPIAHAEFGFAHFYDCSLYPIDVTLPYMDYKPCSLTMNGLISTEPVDKIYIGLSTQRTKKRVLVSVAGADDFILGCRLSIPRVRYVPRTTNRLIRSIEEPMLIAKVGDHKYRYHPCRGQDGCEEWHPITTSLESAFSYVGGHWQGQTNPIPEDKLQILEKLKPEVKESPAVKTNSATAETVNDNPRLKRAVVDFNLEDEDSEDDEQTILAELADHNDNDEFRRDYITRLLQQFKSR